MAATLPPPGVSFPARRNLSSTCGRPGSIPHPYRLPRFPADLFERLPSSAAAADLAAIAAKAYGAPSAACVVPHPARKSAAADCRPRWPRPRRRRVADLRRTGPRRGARRTRRHVRPRYRRSGRRTACPPRQYQTIPTAGLELHLGLASAIVDALEGKKNTTILQCGSLILDQPNQMQLRAQDNVMKTVLNLVDTTNNLQNKNAPRKFIKDNQSDLLAIDKQFHEVNTFEEQYVFFFASYFVQLRLATYHDKLSHSLRAQHEQ